MSEQAVSGKKVEFEEGMSLWKDAWYRLIQNRLALASSIFILFLIAVAYLAPFITSYGYDVIQYDKVGVPPSWEHWFGTDFLGRDLFTRVVYGLRVSMTIGLMGTLVSCVIGVSFGAISAHFGGMTDSLMMRFVDILYALPYVFFVIILMTIFGRNEMMLFIAIGAVSWLTMARIVRGQVMSLKHKEFVEAARAVGVGNINIIFRHLIPNSLGPIIVYSTLTVPRMILFEAFLSFLGLGVQAPKPSLGNLASDGAQAMEVYPWLIIFPAVILALLLFALNFFGDGLRDALDPRMKGTK